MTSLADIARELAGTIEPVTLPSGRRQTPSVRAVQALVNLAENGRSKAEALREAGYSEEIALHPDRVFGSPTIKAALARAGLTEDDALAAIKRAITAKTKDGRDSHHYQLQAADMLANIHGSYAPKRSESKNTHVVGVFSLNDLRKKARKTGAKIINEEQSHA